MKKIFFYVLVFFVPSLCFSQTMNVLENSGSTKSYDINGIRRLYFSGSVCDVHITGNAVGGNYEQYYNFSDVKNITFSNVSCYQGIDNLSGDNPPGKVRNYPNPFNDATTIELYVNNNGSTQINIYNVMGMLIKNLVNSNLDKGIHNFTWDGRNNNGNKLSTGIYFLQVTRNNEVFTNKMFLIN